MKQIAHMWAAAAFSGFATARHWKAWADSRIETADSVDDWLISMSLAGSEDELASALQNRFRQEELSAGGLIYIGNAKLGYLYWMFQLGRFSLAEFLGAAGSEADEGMGDLECETVYAILNELERRVADDSPCDDLARRVDDLFRPYLLTAKSQWESLGLEPPQGETHQRDATMFYVLKPEVPGGLGKNTVMDTSTHPPTVEDLHFEFDGWLGDDLLESFPCFVVTERLRVMIDDAHPTGCSFEAVEISTSEQFNDLYPDRTLPHFFRLKVTGHPGRDDFGISSKNSLVVSERLCEAMKSATLDNCDFEPYTS